MNLLHDQLAVGILELLNIKYDLQNRGISITDSTNIYKELNLDGMDSEFFAWDLDNYFDIKIPESEEETFLDTSFSSLVDYIYNLGATVGTGPREQIYWNDLPMNDADALAHIDGVLSGRINPKYTQSPYINKCDKSKLSTRFQEILRYQQECKELACLEKKAREVKDLKEWYAYVKEKHKEERKRRIIIAIMIAFVIGVSVVGYYTVKKRKQNSKQTSELFQQTKNKAFIRYPIQKTK